jgi:hypothetical protein
MINFATVWRSIPPLKNLLPKGIELNNTNTNLYEKRL